jgi:hypothetical protein
VSDEPVAQWELARLVARPSANNQEQHKEVSTMPG